MRLKTSIAITELFDILSSRLVYSRDLYTCKCENLRAKNAQSEYVLTPFNINKNSCVKPPYFVKTSGFVDLEGEFERKTQDLMASCYKHNFLSLLSAATVSQTSQRALQSHVHSEQSQSQ